jgi:signal transduction histidine kinase/CheY-like chemotaxis protein
MLVLLAGAMTATTLVLSLMTGWHLKTSVDERTKIRDLYNAWQQYFSTIKDAETGQRGFLVSGDETYLEPFQAAVSQLPQTFQKITLLEAETGFAPDVQTKVHKLTDQKLEELRETILIDRREGQEAAKQIFLAGRGKLLMDEIRTSVGNRLKELEARIASQDAAMARDLRWDFYSMGGTSLAALVSGVIAWLLLRDSVRQALREDRLSAEKHRAEQADREKSAFLATMSHEIRTPMNAILGFGELLTGSLQSDKEKRYAQSIVQSGQSLLQIINDILDLSKIEAGMMEVHPESTDVRELGTFVKQLFSAQAAAKGLELQLEVAADVPSSLMLDSLRLRQILINLTGNALKFTDRGFVKLHFYGTHHSETRSQYHLIIQVADSGAGIPANRLHEIFKPFVQARRQSGQEAPGTGLGLAIVKRLAQLMGGTIFVESRDGEGSTFQMDFSSVEISARLPQAAMIDEPEVDFNNLRASNILVVDDNATNRELVRGIFENTHHQIREASDGREAILALQAHRPDVVLMDIRMPVMDGRATFVELRRQRDMELLPIIAVTASSLAGEESNLRKTFNGYVRKPFSRAQLYRELSQFIPKAEPQSPEEVVAEGPATPLDGPALKALTIELRNIETTIWPGVRDGMMLSDVSSFATRLKKLSDQFPTPPFASYVSTLLNHCEIFSLSGMEKSVQDFPSMVRVLETGSPPPSS